MRRHLRHWLESVRTTTRRVFRRRTLRAAISQLRWSISNAWHQFGQLFVKLFRRLKAMRQRQSIRYFVQGLPALLAGAAVGVLAFMIFLDPVEQRVLHYRMVGAQVFRDNNLETAEVIYERLALLDQDQPEYRYRLALTVQVKAEKEITAMQQEAAQSHPEEAKAHRSRAEELLSRAGAMMTALAAPDRQGYGPAHVWLARNLLRQTNSPAALQLAERHLHRALQINADDVAANDLLGQLYLFTGQLKAAESHLSKAVGAMPSLNLSLADLYRRQGAKDLSRLHAEKAQRYFRQQSKADLDNHQARLGWVRATLLLEDYPTAVGILQEGGRLTGWLGYQPPLSQAYLAWSDALARDPKAPMANRLDLLQKAIQCEVGNEAALGRLASLTQSKDEAAAETARMTLRKLLTEGKNTAIVHLLLGMDAQRRGQIEEARLHYEQGYKLSPRTPIIVNNLAWVLAHSDPPEMNQALSLINTVLEKAPNDIRFRETRGQILAKMGKYDEALPDLEAALRGLSGQPALHKTLAEIYRKRGDLATAAEHERRAGPTAALPAGQSPPSTKPDESANPKPDDGKSAPPKSGTEELKLPNK